MRTPAMPECFERLRALTDLFEGRVFVVSKAGPRIAALTERWFVHNGFYEATGIDPRNVRFCRERKQKREHCLEHDITHFIDDRMDVLLHLVGLVPMLYQFGAHLDQRPEPAVQPVPSWSHAYRAIRATL